MTHPEQPSNPVPKLDEVTGAYQDVLDHNKRNTGFGALMKGMIRSMIEEGPITENTEPQVINSGQLNTNRIVDEGEMNAELQDMFHGDTFLRVGLKMEPFGSHISTTEGDRATSSELVPRVDNTELYVGFLSSLQPEDVVEEEDRAVMADVVKQLVHTVGATMSRRSELSLEERALLAEHGEDALRTFIAIEPEYERLGLDAEGLKRAHAEKPAGSGYLWVGKNATQGEKDEKRAHDVYNHAQRDAATYETMQNYVTYWGRNVLPEYIAVGHHLKEGPNTYYFDGLQRKFGEDVAEISSLQKEDRTKQFGHEVAGAYLQSLDDTLQEIDDNPDAWYAHRSNSQAVEKARADLIRAFTEE